MPDPFLDLTLRPHRSLSRSGFAVLMGLLCSVSFLAGIAFFAAGAWPVIGFLGIDVLLVWIAFRVNYARGRARERLTLHADRLEIERIDHWGRCRRHRLEPYWLTVELADRGAAAPLVQLRSHGRTTVVGGFLPVGERAELARLLDEALARWRQGTRSSS
ncbi:MAG: DUF2244 domain-containing protein [Proteobacteria bacterium]|nr:DUF2244 domain-containing protein [Pseudomonadota bacterium]